MSHFVALLRVDAPHLFGWFYEPFLLCNLMRPSVRASIEIERRQIIHFKMPDDYTIQSSVGQSIRGHKENCLFIDSWFPTDSPKYSHINTILKDRYLQFGAEEKKIRKIYEKFGPADKKILKVKLEELAELHK